MINRLHSSSESQYQVSSLTKNSFTNYSGFDLSILAWQQLELKKSSSSVSTIVNYNSNNSDSSEQIKSQIEIIAFVVYLLEVLSMDYDDDNPFDAIYLPKLEPDPIPENAMRRIKMYANIIDKSDEIEFDDGWN